MNKSTNTTQKVTVNAINCLKADTTEISFSNGYTYTLDPTTTIQFLSNSPLVIPEEGTDGKLGILIQEAGSLNEIEGRLSYEHDKSQGTFEFYFDRTDGGIERRQFAGQVKDKETEVKLTLNRGNADGVVIVGTVDTISGSGKS